MFPLPLKGATEFKKSKAGTVPLWLTPTLPRAAPTTGATVQVLVQPGVQYGVQGALLKLVLPQKKIVCMDLLAITQGLFLISVKTCVTSGVS